MACSSCSSSSNSSKGSGSSSLHRCSPLLLLALLLTQLLYTVEAGIAGFSKWFSGTFPTAVLDVMPHQSDKFDHVCFDMNQILHVSLHRAKSEEEAVSTVFFQINNVLSTLKPRKSVVFAFDGSAPLAKLLTQRSRREENRRADRYGLSALHLTPGTAFMDMMTESMRYYAFMRLGATAPPTHTYGPGDKVWLLAPVQPANSAQSQQALKKQKQQSPPTAAAAAAQTAAAAAAVAEADKPVQLEYTGPWMIQRRITPETVLVSKLVHAAGPPSSSSSSSSKKRAKTITATVAISQLKPFKVGQRAPQPPAAAGKSALAFYISGSCGAMLLLIASATGNAGTAAAGDCVPALEQHYCSSSSSGIKTLCSA
eukprot:15237-Heterococcus_DN1.PRE.1